MRRTALATALLGIACGGEPAGPAPAAEPAPAPPEAGIPSVAPAGSRAYAVPELEVCLASSHLEQCIDWLDLESAGPCDPAAQPVPLVRTDPQLPPALAERGVTGWVVVEGRISSAGIVANPRVVESSPEGVLDGLAAHALRRWRYCPHTHSGKLVRERFDFPPR